jgi:hypothetical protein
MKAYKYFLTNHKKDIRMEDRMPQTRTRKVGWNKPEEKVQRREVIASKKKSTWRQQSGLGEIRIKNTG